MRSSNSQRSSQRHIHPPGVEGDVHPGGMRLPSRVCPHATVVLRRRDQSQEDSVPLLAGDGTLSRTAVRNLIRAGVDQSVAMQIGGHETTSTFRRYNITPEEDLRTAVEKLATYVQNLPTERKVVSLGEGRK